ncbi:rho-related GTP-binding protein RhoD [Pipistrellus kuhlii]|uniref:Ras-like protein family member D n=1 Tax=Pipistrellus kuhlii TaxID=59472 RepID=A0A7J7S0J2_PIPKU|nr:rho-related GTP-binding protein RhoD [Pipistrellus kuhlii]KAF6281767.1 ras-like protein family member D [Pipistrellus kuhlii]
MKAAQAAGEEAAAVKVVLVGDGGCGKTSLLMVFAAGDFPESYTPTVFERFNMDMKTQGKPVKLQIWDTAGQVDYDRLRPLFYPDASVVLLCFDVTSPNSFENVSTRWYPEVRHFCKEVPIVLVGCKTDLRKDRTLVNKLWKDKLEPVTYHRGQEMARAVGAVAYLECSARLQENVHAVFQEAVEVALSSRSRNCWRRVSRGCCVLT